MVFYGYIIGGTVTKKWICNSILMTVGVSPFQMTIYDTLMSLDEVAQLQTITLMEISGLHYSLVTLLF